MKGYSLTINPVIDDYAGAINEANGLIASGTGTFGAAYAAGTATVTLNGFTASKVLKANSKVVVPGHNGKYLVTGDIAATAGGVLASVILIPSTGLRSAVASGSPVMIEQDFIPIDGLKASAAYPGESRFTLAGDATIYRLVDGATTTAGGDLGSVRIAPPLRTAPVNNDVATFRAPHLTNAADGVAGIVTFNVTGIAGGTVLTPEGTVNGTVWFGVGVVPTASTTMATTISADASFRLDATGLAQTRLRVTTAGTGTVTVQVAPTVG